MRFHFQLYKQKKPTNIYLMCGSGGWQKLRSQGVDTQVARARPPRQLKTNINFAVYVQSYFKDSVNRLQSFLLLWIRLEYKLVLYKVGVSWRMCLWLFKLWKGLKKTKKI
jgi:hypothetical protein